MWFNKVRAEGVLCYVAVAAATGLAGCADTCFFGYFNSGTGVIAAGAANTTPPCSIKQATPAINVVALKSTACENCASDARVEHLFVTIRSIQLGPATDHLSEDWVEIASELADNPRNIDLIGHSLPEMILENRNVKADTYRTLRIRFCRDSDSNEECRAGSACGRALRNCAIMGDERIEPL